MIRIILFFICLIILYSCNEARIKSKEVITADTNIFNEAATDYLYTTSENSYSCTDTLILLTDFPNFPFGEIYITREWVMKYFGVEENDMKFAAITYENDTSFVDSVFVLNKGGNKIEFKTGDIRKIDTVAYKLYSSRIYNEGIKRGGIEKFIKSLLHFPYANIEDHSVSLANSIRVGISKETFFKNLSINNVNRNCNTFFITDAEWQCYHKFYFRDDKLYRIELRFME